MADYYELLGVSRDGDAATRSSGRTASKARELHPDANPDDAATAERFKEVARAYEVLSDPDQRARYDRFGEAGVGGAGGPRVEDVFGGGGLNDLFDAFFGGQNPFGGGRPARPGRAAAWPGPRGRRRHHVRAGRVRGHGAGDAEAAAALRRLRRQRRRRRHPAGDVRRLQRLAVRCSGSARACSARWSRAAPCPRCGGLGQVVVTPCPTCRGEGRITAEHTYQVDVPAGVDTGSTLRLERPRRGRPARRRRPATCTSTCASPQHERYWRDGNDLVTTCRSRSPRPRSARRSTLPTLDGDEELVVPAGTQPGREFVLRGRGVPRLQGRGRGDLRAQLVVEVPTKLDDDEAALLRQLAEKRGEAVNPPDKGLFSRIKSAFS